MNFKTKAISTLLAGATALTLVGCSESNPDNRDISSDKPGTSQIVKDTTTIFDDFSAMKDWDAGIASIDMSFKIDETDIDMSFNTKSDTTSSITYMNIDNIHVKTPSETGDISEVSFKDIELYASADTVYVDMDLVYEIVRMSDPTMDMDLFKAQFKHEYGDAKYMTIALEQTASDINTSFVTSLPEDVTIDEITDWLKTTAAPAFEKSFEDIRDDFITTGEIHKFFINNKNLVKLANKLNEMLDDGTLKSLMSSFKSLSESAGPMTDEEYETFIGDFETSLADFVKSLESSDNNFVFELESDINNNNATLTMIGDAVVKATVTSGDTDTVKNTAIKFNINIDIENSPVSLTAPAETDCISSDIFSAE